MQRIILVTGAVGGGLVVLGLAAFFTNYLRTQAVPPVEATIDVTGQIDASKLQPGNHTFEIRARASSGEEVSQVVPFTVQQTPAPAANVLETEPEATPSELPETAPVALPSPAEVTESPLPEESPLTSPPASL